MSLINCLFIALTYFEMQRYDDCIMYLSRVFDKTDGYLSQLQLSGQYLLNLK